MRKNFQGLVREKGGRQIMLEIGVQVAGIMKEKMKNEIIDIGLPGADRKSKCGSPGSNLR